MGVLKVADFIRASAEGWKSHLRMLPALRCAELADAGAKAISDFSGHAQNQIAFDPGTSRRDFIATTLNVGELHFLPPLMAHLDQKGLHCNLRSEAFSTADVGAALKDGRCDLALSLYPNLEQPTLYTQQTFMHTLICLLRADHPTVQYSRISMHRFLELSHVVVKPMGRSQEFFDAPAHQIHQ